MAKIDVWEAKNSLSEARFWPRIWRSLKISSPIAEKQRSRNSSSITQNFTTIGGTVAEISVPGQKSYTKYVSKQHIPQTPGGGVTTMCNTPRPAPLSRATFPSLIARLYLLGSRARGWCIRHASKYNFCLLWPWFLTPWPMRSAVHALALGDDLCQVSLKSVYS